MGCVWQGAILSPLRALGADKGIFQSTGSKLKKIQAGIAKLHLVYVYIVIHWEHTFFQSVSWTRAVLRCDTSFVRTLSCFLSLLLPLSFPFTFSGSFSLLYKDTKLNRAIPSLSPTSIYFANGNDKSLRGSVLSGTGLCICKFSQRIIIFSHGHKAMLLKTSPGNDKPWCRIRWAEASIFIYSLWLLFYLYIFQKLEFRQFNRLEK